ncbi:MAG: hypothetical protein WA364_17905 [Candidatus Nitrosopolaris sp.]
MAKNVLPFVILGIAGLGVVWVLYKMFKSKDQHRPVTHAPIPIHTSVPVHAGHRIVSSVGTGPSAAHKARYGYYK